MEIVIELPRDIDKLCRTCMNIVEDEKNCVVSNDNDQENELNKMLFYLTGATISPNECLPKYMCNACVKKLEISYIFKQLCQSTYLNLKNFMDSSENDVSSEIKCEFTCSMCDLSYPSNYMLSKHQIDHYKDNRLFKIFKSEESNDLKNDLIEDEEDMISSLVAERKEWNDDVETENNTDRKIDILENNQDLMDEIKLKNCDLCDRVFDSLMSLQLHFINHAILAESDTDPGIFQQFFQCCNCGETFNNQDDMDNHQREKCPKDLFKPIKCRLCHETFESDLLFLKHNKDCAHSDCLWEDYAKTTDKEQYACAICNESFTVKSELYLHSVRHIIKKITCRICKKSFSCQIAHNNHLRSHPKYKHMCNLCGKWLGSRHALKTHVMGVHSVSKNFVCSVCSKAFKTPSRLYIHKLTHKEDKKFVCSVCDYKTNYVGDFRVHNRIHTSERPYKCNFVNCKRQFKTSSHLNEHIQRHLQIKKYQCNMCYMVFGHNHTLKMHLMVHTGEKPFTCQFCKVKFRRKHHLKNHMKQHANEDTENIEKNSTIT